MTDKAVVPTPTPGVKVDLGGKARTLRYDKAALVRLEDEQGITIGGLGRRLGDVSLRGLAAALWAGLLHEDPSMTTERALDLIDLERLGEISKAVGSAVDAAFPDIVPEGSPGKP